VRVFIETFTKKKNLSKTLVLKQSSSFPENGLLNKKKPETS